MATWLYLFALTGLLVVFRLWLESRQGFAHGCLGFQRTEKIDCAAVVLSEAGRFLGISNITWGGLYYLTLALIQGVRILVPTMDAPLQTATAVLVGWGLIYTGYLVWYQHRVLKKYCPLCLASATTVGLLAILTVLDLLRGPDAPMVPWVAVAATLLFAGAVLIQLLEARGSMSAVRCGYDPRLPYIENWQQLIHPLDPVVGNPDAPVTVVEFFDPNCPHCRAFHQEMKRLLQMEGNRIRVVFKPVPLWEYSVRQIEALYLAQEQGKFLEMLEAQYARQRKGGLSNADLEAIAGAIGMNVRKLRVGILEARYRKPVLQARKDVFEAGIQGVPTVLINGKVVAHMPESMTAECLSRLIEAEYERLREGAHPEETGARVAARHARRPFRTTRF